MIWCQQATKACWHQAITWNNVTLFRVMIWCQQATKACWYQAITWNNVYALAVRYAATQCGDFGDDITIKIKS